MLHQRVRREFWGYAVDEKLSNQDLIAEKYIGIRPAMGYPASPDHSEKDILWGLLGVKERHGADALGFISSSRCTGEENYLVQKLARAAFGTNNCHQCAAT